jgi:3-oxoacyl-[acyl-carrier protein] reductase
MKMSGKICVVTGGGSGIGKAIVEKFLEYGAELVYAVDLNPKALAELEAAHKNVRGAVVSVTDTAAVNAFALKVKEEKGRIDVLVNCAGVTKDALIQKMTDEDWQFVIDVNLKGPFVMTRAIGPIMMETGKGSIVTISSVVGLDGNIGQSSYAATKGGVISMTKTWAREFTRKGANVRANAVAPGFINTPMMATVPDKVLDPIKEKTYFKRLGEPSEIAEVVAFLASDEASFVTGQVIRASGGLVV